MSADPILAAIAALRTDLARQHTQVLRLLGEILAALSPPPSPPDLNPLGALMAANRLRTEQALAELQATLNRDRKTGTADVLPMPRREEEPS